MADRSGIDMEGFHSGQREVLTQVYRTYVARVERTVSRYCRGADAECVVHEVFLAVIERADVRRCFTGGDMGAWLATMAQRRAVDYLRRQRRWTPLDEPRSIDGRLPSMDDEEQGLIHEDQVRHLNEALARFAQQIQPGLDSRLARVFELRFRRWLSQTEAARELDIARTTLIHREGRLMRRLGPFLRRYFRGERQ